MIPPFIQTSHSLTVVIDSKALSMVKGHRNWDKALEALKGDDVDLDALKNLFDLALAVKDYVSGSIAITDGVLFYRGEIVNNVVVEKILAFMSEGLPYKPLIRFLDKLMANPSRRSVNELYSFLEHKSMPITEDGNFIAYKGVRPDYKDVYSGKFDNSVGAVLSMTRNAVCDDADVGCSYGFHAGSHEYAKGYAAGGGHLMLVEINPADVVSVPKDCSCQKLRTSTYKVIAKLETIDTPLKEELYGDYDDEDDDGYDEDEKDEAYQEAYQDGYEQAKQDGYEQAKQDLINKLSN